MGLPGIIRSLWGYFRDPQLFGRPVHRKIDPQEAIDRTRQDSDGANRDFAYMIRRFPHLPPGECRSSFDASYKSISDEVDPLSSRIGNTSIGPLSSAYPGNSSRGRPPARACYVRNFRSHAAYARPTPTFPARQASILYAYFRTGRLMGPLPQETRGALIDYWGAPRRLEEILSLRGRPRESSVRTKELTSVRRHLGAIPRRVSSPHTTDIRA